MTRTSTSTTPDGVTQTLVSPRLDGRSVMTAVRAFYLDIAEWADDDPARWAPWAVRCPVSATDVSHKKDRSQRKARMDQRTRERLPVLPVLTAWVQAQRARTAAVLDAAQRAAPGGLFTAGGSTLRRSVMKPLPAGGSGSKTRPAADATTPASRNTAASGRGRWWKYAAHEYSHRGTERTIAPQPHPVPPARHRRTDPAAADHPVQDRPGTVAGDLTGTGRRAVHDHRPDPRTPPSGAAGGVLRQERTPLQPADAAAVPITPTTTRPAGLRNLATAIPRCRAHRYGNH